MAQKLAAKRIQKSPKSNAKKNNLASFFKQNHLSSFVAGFGGAAFGIALMLAVALPMMHRQLQADVASLNHGVVAMSPADMTTGLTCAAPTGGSGSGVIGTGQNQPMIQTASATTPSTPVGGMGSGPTGSTGGNIITKLIGVYHTDNTATISNTGADSTNTIKQTTNNTTTVDNDNDIFAVNNNPQTASSGNVNSSQNTTTGSTTSGSASNQSNTSFAIKVNN